MEVPTQKRAAAVAASLAACYVGAAWLDRPVTRQCCRGLWTPLAVATWALCHRRDRGDTTQLREALWCVWRALPPVAQGVAVAFVVPPCARLVATVRRTLLRRRSASDVREAATSFLVAWAEKNVPPFRRMVREELRKAKDDLRKSLKRERASTSSVLPERGRSKRELLEELQTNAAAENAKWESGLVSGAVYSGEKEHVELLNAASAAYAVANPLHPDVWPSVNEMEAEVISMTARLLDGGDSSVCGALTSGGTESIVLAIKAHRDKFREERGLSRGGGGQVVACVTAHAAAEKACDLLGMTLVLVPTTDDFRIDVAAARAAVTADTVLLYASAPAFPQGAVDDVPAIAEIARRHGVGCHVDCCLGGFVLPFLASSDTKFDFGVAGVTSMSVDAHKYGYAPKGTSVVLYRSADWRKYQYFCSPRWTGGLYVTPTIAGSRSGAVVAATWASLVSLGAQGLRDRATRIHAVANEIAGRIFRDFSDDLRLLGASEAGSVDAMIVCFALKETSSLKNVYALNDELVKFGWALNALQRPPCLHLCCTVRTTADVAERFLSDLRTALDSLLRRSVPPAEQGGSAAIYGMASSMPAGPVTAIMQAYTDILLDVV